MPPLLSPWPFLRLSHHSLPPVWAAYLQATAFCFPESRSSSQAWTQPSPTCSLKNRGNSLHTTPIWSCHLHWKPLKDSPYLRPWSLTRPTRAWPFSLFCLPYYALLFLSFCAKTTLPWFQFLNCIALSPDRGLCTCGPHHHGPPTCNMVDLPFLLVTSCCSLSHLMHQLPHENFLCAEGRLLWPCFHRIVFPSFMILSSGFWNDARYLEALG